MILKTTKNHLIPLDYEEKRFATNNELLIDKETNDLYATDKNGELIDFYEEYLSRLEKDEVIKRHEIYGISIDMNNSDPEGSVTYIKRSKKFTPLTIDLSTGECDYGSWKDIITDFFGVRPCIFSDKVEAYLDPNDYSRTVDGVDASKYKGNVMIEFRKQFYKFTVTDDILEFKVSNVNTDGTYIQDAFLVDSSIGLIVNDYMYISVYPSCKDDSDNIKSLPGFEPYLSTESLTDLLSKIESRDTRQTVLGYSRYLYILGIAMLVSKSTDVSIFGKGSGNYISGTLSNKGLFYGTEDGPSKVFGMENLWTGLPELCGGLMCKKGTIYSLSHGPYKEINNGKNTNIKINIPENQIVTGYASKYEIGADIIFPKEVSLDLESVNKFKGICVYVNDPIERYAAINNGGIQFFDSKAPLIGLTTRLSFC